MSQADCYNTFLNSFCNYRIWFGLLIAFSCCVYTPCPRKKEAALIFDITSPSVEMFLKQFLKHFVQDNLCMTQCSVYVCAALTRNKDVYCDFMYGEVQ